jgi:hypothetical protein
MSRAVFLTAVLVVAAACSRSDRTIATDLSLGPATPMFDIAPPLSATGHFSQICVVLPPGGTVDIHAGAVVLPTGGRPRFSASLWTDSGARRDLTTLTLLRSSRGESACLTSSDLRDGTYVRLSLLSSEAFRTPEIFWIDSDKM